MEPPTPTPPAATIHAKCTNCRYPITAELPAKCPECGFLVITPTPTWSQRPMGWGPRLLIIGWPLIGFAIGLPFVNMGGPIGSIAPVITVGCFLLAFANAPVLGIAASTRPPAFIEGEPPERTKRRRRITTVITLGLALMIPVLLFGSCLHAFTAPH